MIKASEIKFLRQDGYTFQEIGEALGVTRQRVHQVYTKYPQRYWKTARYLMYRRHLGHKIHTKPYKPCDYCIKEREGLSRVLFNLSQ